MKRKPQRTTVVKKVDPAIQGSLAEVYLISAMIDDLSNKAEKVWRRHICELLGPKWAEEFKAA